MELNVSVAAQGCKTPRKERGKIICYVKGRGGFTRNGEKEKGEIFFCIPSNVIFLKEEKKVFSKYVILRIFHPLVLSHPTSPTLTSNLDVKKKNNNNCSKRDGAAFFSLIAQCGKISRNGKRMRNKKLEDRGRGNFNSHGVLFVILHLYKEYIL